VSISLIKVIENGGERHGYI